MAAGIMDSPSRWMLRAPDTLELIGIQNSFLGMHLLEAAALFF